MNSSTQIYQKNDPIHWLHSLVAHSCFTEPALWKYLCSKMLSLFPSLHCRFHEVSRKDAQLGFDTRCEETGDLTRALSLPAVVTEPLWGLSQRPRWARSGKPRIAELPGRERGTQFRSLVSSLSKRGRKRP